MSSSLKRLHRHYCDMWICIEDEKEVIDAICEEEMEELETYTKPAAMAWVHGSENWWVWHFLIQWSCRGSSKARLKCSKTLVLMQQQQCILIVSWEHFTLVMQTNLSRTRHSMRILQKLAVNLKFILSTKFIEPRNPPHKLNQKVTVLSERNNNVPHTYENLKIN